MGSNSEVPDPEVPAKARSRTYSAAYKARILEEYESLDKAGKGALLRREGLYSSLITTWRQQRDQGARQALARPAGRPPGDARDKELARLRRENERLASGARHGADGDRGPGKTLRAVGSARDQQRPGLRERAEAVIDAAIIELTAVLGSVRRACAVRRPAAGQPLPAAPPEPETRHGRAARA